MMTNNVKNSYQTVFSNKNNNKKFGFNFLKIFYIFLITQKIYRNLIN